MMTLGKPAFGICRGFQERNVAFGGSLRRVGEAVGDIAHHSPPGVTLAEMFAHEHVVKPLAACRLPLAACRLPLAGCRLPVAAGQLAAAFGDRPLTVNSVDYQGGDWLGEGLTVEAHGPDGLVEAFSTRLREGRVLAVQWHPEWDAPPTRCLAGSSTNLAGR